MDIGNYSGNPPVIPYFAYTTYNSTTQVSVVNNYKATATGPILVTSQNVVTYDEIPRVGTLDLSSNYRSSSQYLQAVALGYKSSLTLSETVQCINYIDKTFQDISGDNGIRAQMLKAIFTFSNSLPDDQKADATVIVESYMNSELVDNTPRSHPFIIGKNYIFDSNGYPSAAGDAGNLIQIQINGVKKLPSELDVNDYSQRKILAKIAVFLSRKADLMGTANVAPIGTWFATGKHPNPTRLSSTVPALTLGTDPFMTVLNTRGDKYSTALDNISSFVLIIKHELKHQYKYKHFEKQDLKTHTDIYIDGVEDLNFRSIPPGDKLSTVVSLANYIFNMDKKPGYTFANMKEAIDRLNVQAYYNNGYKIIAPRDQDPNHAPNILFTKGDLNKNNFKVYDPESNQEINTNEIYTITDEK
nr:hypothetical protein [uncultured Flavobacterium sp.]